MAAILHDRRFRLRSLTPYGNTRGVAGPSMLEALVAEADAAPAEDWAFS